ncbi:MAG: ABC transporter permease [bacterium]|nr:ABC transporter permease [bacterium]
MSTAHTTAENSRKKQLKQDSAGLWLTLPFLLYILTFFIIPLCSVAVMSTYSVDDNFEISKIFTAENFRQVFDLRNLPILLRSVKFACITTILCITIAYPMAWFISRYGGKRKIIWILLMMMPFWTSYLVRIFSWITLLQTEGVINNLLIYLGIISEPLNMLNTPFSVILGLTYGFLPFAALPIFSNLEKLDNNLLDASADLGASPSATFFKVILPNSYPGITAAFILTFIPAMGDFVTPEILGDVNTQLIGNLIQQQYLGTFNWPLGSALALVLMAIMLIIIVFFSRYIGSLEDLAS